MFTVEQDIWQPCFKLQPSGILGKLASLISVT